MALYTRESLETLRSKVDLAELLSSYLELKRAGASYKALCPFHDEKTPSFQVQRGDSHYHCFGCGAHGDAIQFLMEYQNLTFADAVETLAQRFGVLLERVEKEREFSGPSKNQIREGLEKAARFYHYFLLHTEEGRGALEYLFKRGIDLDFIREFQIGLAPKRAGIFQKCLLAHQVSHEALRLGGLVAEAAGGYTRDFFMERILFPIRDATGGVIGFSGRKYREETFGGKYVNTSETPLFKKSRVLFGLNYSRRRIAKERKVIVVEGQVDALRLIKEGFNLTVAAQGTAFGEGHVQELLRLGIAKAYLAMDADDAGREAASKIGHLLQAAGVEVVVAQLPQGEDPDALLLKEGPQVFAQLLEEGADYLTFLVDHLGRGVNRQSPAGKNQLVQQVVQRIREWENPLLVHEGLRQVARLLSVPEGIVSTLAHDHANIYIRRSDTVKGALSDVDPDRIIETDLLRLLLLSGEKQRELMEIVRINLPEEALKVSICRALFKALMNAHGSGKSLDLISLTMEVEEEGLQELMDEIHGRPLNPSRLEAQMEATLQRILERNWMCRGEEIKARIHSGQCEEEEALDLVRQLAELKRQRPRLQKMVLTD